MMAFHESVGNTGPSSDIRNSPPRLAARSLRISICSFAWTSSQPLFCDPLSPAMAIRSSAIAVGILREQRDRH